MNTEAEIWKPVVGFEALYSVSSLGRVRREAGGKGCVPGRILKPAPLSGGHLRVNIHRGGKAVTRQVHRLVALSFLGAPPSEKHEAAHYDGNPTNNLATNLRWATRAENESDKIRHGTSNRGERCGSAKLTEQDVLTIRRAYAADGVSQQDLAERFGVSRPQISDIVNFKRWVWLKGAA